MYASRNLAIVATAVGLMVAEDRGGLAILFSAAAVLPIFDMVMLRSSGQARPPYARHLVALGVLVTCAVLWWGAR